MTNSSKFDELVISVNEVKVENNKLRRANELLRQRVDDLEGKVSLSIKDVEALRRDSRRTTLEIQVVPMNKGESTNAIDLKVAQLVAPERRFDE